MNIKEILMGGGGVALVLATLIQVSPLKLNPWDWLKKLPRVIGHSINGEVLEEVKSLDKSLKELRDVCDEREAKAARVRILRFGDEIYYGTQHSRDHFEQILEDILEYEDYCKAHPGFKNEMTTLTVARIRNIYEVCLKEHKFL